MKRFVVWIPVAFLLFVAMRTPEPAPAFSVEVRIAPSSLDRILLLERPTPTSFTARAIVTEVEEPAHVLAMPKVIVEPGERDTVVDRVGDLDVKFTVAISEKRDRAATELVVERGGRVVQRQKSDFVLDAAAVKPKPLPRR